MPRLRHGFFSSERLLRGRDVGGLLERLVDAVARGLRRQRDAVDAGEPDARYLRHGRVAACASRADAAAVRVVSRKGEIDHDGREQARAPDRGVAVAVVGVVVVGRVTPVIRIPPRVAPVRRRDLVHVNELDPEVGGLRGLGFAVAACREVALCRGHERGGVVRVQRLEALGVAEAEHVGSHEKRLVAAEIRVRAAQREHDGLVDLLRARPGRRAARDEERQHARTSPNHRPAHGGWCS